MSNQNDDDNILNGDARLILLRISQMDGRLCKVETKVDALHDKMLKQPPMCPAPGSCIRLEHQLEKIVDQEYREHKEIWEAISAMKRLVWIGVGIIATISFVMPLVVAALKRTLT
jgi:hypothetical protein